MTYCDSDISATNNGTNVNDPPLDSPDNILAKYSCHGYIAYSIRIQLI